ncbi:MULTISPECIES: hypothetical protein [Chryseobacterium]|uniref:Uncharacterized protein n=1 Tax=Chryseobacterium camelliae TaxID=1265445 RepID=A0ABU0TCP2_9FLAO|nr:MULTISPECIES: hypothetical protein [Chryseobacterium]MDT3407352.1 hypothetical protein [Pseudacidovorax intermedius]MDQ1094859.1 hypothetical protein [Chryseobacterium camelliae]MDQ1098799.1 hypothetical protein [Chryseobacterium sp. SORGH_AS_1048]MDR6086150.1 hypothetical protein [Chryseobacterium sp. SORGH_AS_0909]MDR6130520.1 hypothetical protein [Chryseobacterium sp. SORGH_AS_1175]
MKKIILITATICSALTFGQKVSDFRYVSVPQKFQTFKNSFGLEGLLSKILKGKKYVVLSGDQNSWPAELKANPCQVINADVINDKSLLRNKVILAFKDCNGKTVLESKGTSMIKEFEEGFPDALQQAVKTVAVSNPVEQINIVSNVQSEKPVAANNVSEPVTASASSGTVKYTNGKISLQKIQIDDSQFILAEPNSSIPYATFKATTKTDVFRVKLQNGSSTIGYVENGTITIEIPKENGDVVKEVFIQK